MLCEEKVREIKDILVKLKELEQNPVMIAVCVAGIDLINEILEEIESE